ncbi:interferon-induced protein with tetratricopeptide repeats 5-like [Melanotaenia boesemani]|uniref:interferon-induced protein with tetratricopeptide repeats 5-like n=1 Tax=Melanotaenia boesemani TaxID=1250792 RepID=UPI001C04FC1C|nr:interferon-induced protein with tetratricopeptide repeats 5-like [Melanotaenia boesemani]
MSAAQSQSKLESLECHFTWNLDTSRSKLFSLRDELVDIGTEEGNIWLGHIYNLQGFIHYKLGFIEEARDFFSRATETFHQLGDADEGPWLVVNYGNLAWLHQHLGEDSQSQRYLSKLDTLMEKHPPPIQDELHPEVCAEKAWTLMKFDKDKKLQAADYFQRAVRMKPEMVSWQTSRVLVLVGDCKHSDKEREKDQDVGMLEEIRKAREEDPDNLYLAAVDLLLRAKRREQIKDEADELEEKILMNPVSSYSGIKTLMKVYRQLNCYKKAIDLAEKALKKHPDERYLKRCAALSYRWKFFFNKESSPSESMISRAISLHEEVVSLYPDSSLMKEVDLANMYAKSGHGLMKAEQMYKEMLERDLDPADKQMLYNCYAKHLQYDRREGQKSNQYHMKAAEIPYQSFIQQNSINQLQRISGRGRNRMCREIQEFLQKLPGSDSL